MTRVLIVGAGVLGASTAYHLARAGVSVTVLERGAPGVGTSGSSFAWVNAQDKAPDAYFELNHDGVRSYPGLAADLGGDWFHPTGDLVIGRGPGAAKVIERSERHQARGYPVETLDRSDVHRLEPAVDLGHGDIAAARFSAEAWVDAPRLIERLLGAVTSAGGSVEAGELASIAVVGGRATGVTTVAGATLEADHVVLATGAATEALARSIDIAVPMAPSPGLLVDVGPVPSLIGHVIHAGDVAIRPAPGDRILVTSREVDATLDPSVRQVGADDEAVLAVLERATRLVPALQGVPVDDVRVGVRSVTVDGQPAIGPAPGIEGLYVVVSHSGVTLAPVIGRLVAAELGGDRQAALDPYRLARFATDG